jgi:hypothetical protein
MNESKISVKHMNLVFYCSNLRLTLQTIIVLFLVVDESTVGQRSALFGRAGICCMREPRTGRTILEKSAKELFTQRY